MGRRPLHPADLGSGRLLRWSPQSRRCERSLQRLLAQRLFGLAFGHEDTSNHDRLQDDSLLAFAVGGDDITGASRSRGRDRGHPLAGSSTLNQFESGTPEHAAQDSCKRIVADPERLGALLVELFLESYAKVPEEIVQDAGATDDPLHGRQGVPSLASTTAIAT